MRTPRVIPEHLAIIMDGNGRWAQARGRPRIAGHRRGVEVVRRVVELCGKHEIPFLTLFAFSSENWNRPVEEVGLLTRLLVTSLDNEVQRLHDNGVRLKVIGDLAPFGSQIEEMITRAEEATQVNTALKLTIALNYGGRWDMLQAVQRIGIATASGELDCVDVDEELISSYLSTANQPDPDLFIRTGGELRISNFLLWQLAYTELFFTDALWPDFDEKIFLAALEAYRVRQRRFGQTREQVLSSS
ncbi:MAG TPA: di-trans,poly-cis-decaprenylcistransferase [Gammaproteobacteria bacterium]|mgnify:FL=1|nr:isoprenyl transferase [Arenicellales bacterium]HCY14161.1 di-trans,poly-cis-decaprenylcistransferase [Gammaproteobacteria bacterium]